MLRYGSEQTNKHTDGMADGRIDVAKTISLLLSHEIKICNIMRHSIQALIIGTAPLLHNPTSHILVKMFQIFDFEKFDEICF